MDSIAQISHNVHIVCDTISSKVNCITQTPHNSPFCQETGWTDVIIALIVCITLGYIAYWFFKNYFGLKDEIRKDEKKLKDEERLTKENQKYFELTKEYEAKILDYLKEETKSYSTILKEFNKKKTKNLNAQDNIKSTITKIKEKLAANTYLSHSVFCEIHNMLTSIEKTLDEIETIEHFDQQSFSTKKDNFNNSIQKNAYLNAINEFLGIK